MVGVIYWSEITMILKNLRFCLRMKTCFNSSIFQNCTIFIEKMPKSNESYEFYIFTLLVKNNPVVTVMLDFVARVYKKSFT